VKLVIDVFLGFEEKTDSVPTIFIKYAILLI